VFPVKGEDVEYRRNPSEPELRQSAWRPIQVALAGTTPPAGTASQAYSYDIRPLLTVTGDANFDAAGQLVGGSGM
jgi:hypothetical protein